MSCSACERSGICMCYRPQRLPVVPQAVPVQGWVCPRCGVVHSPWVAQCTCQREIDYPLAPTWGMKP